jgi:hypothetical protein
MKTIHRRLGKLEEGLGLLPPTEDEKRLHARIEAGRARLIGSGYQVTEPDESELAGMTVTEILQRGRQRARASWEQLQCELSASGNDASSGAYGSGGLRCNRDGRKRTQGHDDN